MPVMEPAVTPKTGADILIESLLNEGVDTVFGYPGGAVLPIYDAIYRAKGKLQHLLFRHEQGSIHAAEGFARVTGKPGVVIATSGPGATNLITGITDAMMDSLPLVIFTGQVATGVIGTDAFQEADIIGITTPITKHNYQVRSIADLPRVIKEAFHIASTGRPGPVVIDIPKDISGNPVNGEFPSDFHLPGYQPTTKPNPLQIVKLADALSKAKRPIILAGAGILHGKASVELIKLAEKHQLPVTTTLLGLGSFPGNHPLALGMAGMHGTFTANMALYECDLLLNIGARFDDRLTGNLKHFAPQATVAHIDIDPAEIGKNVPTSIPIVADARQALIELLKQEFTITQHTEWLEKLEVNKSQFPLWYQKYDESISPQELIEKVHQFTNGEAIVVTDVGQHQMWAAQYYTLSKPDRWVTSGGLGTMGFGFPAAIGAQLADPERTVVALVGDGGFQMTLQELGVLQERNLPVKVVIVNNGALGMVRQWQQEFYGERYSESLLPVQPDFVKLAESYSIKGVRIDSADQLSTLLPEALAFPGPVVVDCRVVPTENVNPMVAPGKGLHEMIGVKP
ncbi:acetolactate synthase, large subunit, biosynthetic type [Bacillus sp. FJAT-27225]|uniref:acetolactate synthase large subunit n=1 Tax=Bacillus sp. FJAT-27225 TaxID=1743144 RepID=UPI00080C289D|nr:acetolactate synthase large subunit [Bacillus sp. FJAT-27225]OCA83391.1 acetolactate synthase, large subunit, biosynthetic type [Bacillus sp. FJAT-27225]